MVALATCPLGELSTMMLPSNKKEDQDSFDIDGESLAELSWHVQGYQATTARENGFIACRSEDEQGTVYAINLVNREDLLTYKGVI